MCGQPHGARLTGVTSGRTNHRVQFLPLGGIQAPVTPAWSCSGVGCEWARLPGLTELRPRLPMHHRSILLADLLTRSGIRRLRP